MEHRLQEVGAYIEEFQAAYMDSLTYMPSVSAAIDAKKQGEAMEFMDSRPDGIVSSVELTEYEACELFQVRARNLLLTDVSAWSANLPASANFTGECLAMLWR